MSHGLGMLTQTDNPVITQGRFENNNFVEGTFSCVNSFKIESIISPDKKYSLDANYSVYDFVIFGIISTEERYI